MLSNTRSNNTSKTTSTTTQKEPIATLTPAVQDVSGAEVSLTLTGFSPKTITVKAGTKVVWTNSSGQAGNVSSNLHPTHLIYPALNLGNFEGSQSVSLVFDKAGTYGYHNHLNTTETGTIVVEQ